MVSPSEQVDHAWHLHQLFTAQYRRDTFGIFGRLFKHLPALGGKADAGIKFDNVYEETLSYYRAMFGQEPKPHIWEPTKIRFSHEIFSFSCVNLNRLASMNIVVALGNLKHSESKKERYDQIIVGKLERHYASLNRNNYVIARRNIRLDVKNHIQLQADYKETELLKIYGCPLFMPICVDREAYKSQYILDEIEKGMFFDYESFDGYEVMKLYPHFGAQEVMERLVDLGHGDFDVEDGLDQNY